MKEVKLHITPQTFVRATQGDRVFFRIPREQLRPAGLKRLLRLERYNQYKIDLSALAKQARFLPYEQGMHVVFYLPVPKTWKKYKKEYMHLQLHQSKPDWDNLAKAFFDSLMFEDKHIADVRITKKWINHETGHIEIYQTAPAMRSSDILT
jgi:Holliday junction resolvase RusA-like endonuclease